jgi:hypothetical protein
MSTPSRSTASYLSPPVTASRLPIEPTRNATRSRTSAGSASRAHGGGRGQDGRDRARDERSDGLPDHHAVHVQAQDLALDRVVGVPDEAVLQRQRRRVAR